MKTSCMAGKALNISGPIADPGFHLELEICSINKKSWYRVVCYPICSMIFLSINRIRGYVLCVMFYVFKIRGPRPQGPYRPTAYK